MLTVDIDRARIEAGCRVLDLGCGGGRHAFACVRVGAYVVAIDSHREEVAAVSSMIGAMVEADEIEATSSSFAVGDAMALPIVDGAFDRVVIAEVLEHLPDDQATIVELVRVLRPGGFLALSVPRAGPERVNWALSRQYHETPGGHLRIYRRRALIDKIERAGLRKVDEHHAHGLHSPYWWLRCAVGIDNDHNAAVALYHRLLVWDITDRPRVTRVLDRMLNPLIGKSLVLYFEKPMS